MIILQFLLIMNYNSKRIFKYNIDIHILKSIAIILYYNNRAKEN